ncbi:hypothetical protein ACG92U_05895 [Leuconostoc citreum]
MTIKNTYISNENANQNFWRQDNTLASKLVIPNDESKEASQIQDLLQKGNNSLTRVCMLLILERRITCPAKMRFSQMINIIKLLSII